MIGESDAADDKGSYGSNNQEKRHSCQQQNFRSLCCHFLRSCRYVFLLIVLLASCSAFNVLYNTVRVSKLFDFLMMCFAFFWSIDRKISYTGCARAHRAGSCDQSGRKSKVTRLLNFDCRNMKLCHRSKIHFHLLGCVPSILGGSKRRRQSNTSGTCCLLLCVADHQH